MNKKTVAIGLLSILIIILLFLIETNSIESFDISIYNLISLTINENLTNFFKFMTLLGEGVSIAGFCVLALIVTFVLKKRDMGLIIAGCVAFNSLFSEVNESSYSFPSSHAVASVSLCGILIYFIFRSGWDRNVKIAISTLLVLFPLLIGISRIYLGVHNASDVFGGAILAMILLLIEISIIEKKELF